MVMSRRTSLAVTAAMVLLVAPIAATARASASEEFLTGLRSPAGMAFAPDGAVFFTEKDTGAIRIALDGQVLPQPLTTLDVVSGSETGLLGIALDPNFPDQPWLYAYFTDADDGTNRLVRIRVDGNQGGERQVLLDALPAEAGYHNGGALAFDAAGMLLITVGEIHDAKRAQNPDDIGGKVLRLTPDGEIPADNPTPGSPVFSLGHRNSYGICLDPASGDIWETENGPERDDEINLIEPGGNYGWPDVLGPGSDPRFIDPVVVFPRVIVPTGCTVADGALWFGSYGDGSVRQLALPASGTTARATVAATLPSGILAMATGPDGAVYASTSEAIWRITDEAAATSAPAPAAGAPSSTAPPVDRSAGGGSGWRPWIVAAAAIVLVAGLALRWKAGRGLHRTP
jgi:glucose/arabinose dehydrogenase